ncbi:hypothetical protein [Aeoliella sp. SH292]|uniref:hypothetical protein n=1 Tax=Aeoliella sp. SH292 TaxID=3454464 RepID=UPI003F99108D
MPDYQYLLSFPLADDSPASVTQFFEQLAAGETPDALPESDERALETSSAEVITLLAGRTRFADGEVTIVGRATPEEFFMPFMALAEWLARWSAGRGPVGYYHHTALAHPTVLYFAAGKPYMAQATATPIGLADGLAMNDQ